MLRRKIHTRLLSRLMAGLFALQLIGTGFCLLTPDAHAMPAAHAVMSHDIHMAPADEHCAQPAEHREEHGASCAHCLQPQVDLSAKHNQAPSQIALALLPDFFAPDTTASLGNSIVSLASRTPTGPPRSSTLIYDITQRIRV